MKEKMGTVLLVSFLISSFIWNLQLLAVNGDSDKDYYSKILKELECVNCKVKFKYPEPIEFQILNGGKETSYVYFGIKIKTDRGWKILTDDVRENSFTHKYPSWEIKPGEKTNIIWNKYIAYSADLIKKDHLKIEEIDPFTTYDLKKGGELMLFAWKISAFDHGVHKILHKFILLPK